MILRLAGSAAIHTAGGIAMGVTAVLAACTLAQVVKVAAEGMSAAGNRAARPGPSDGGPTMTPARSMPAGSPDEGPDAASD